MNKVIIKADGTMVSQWIEVVLDINEERTVKLGADYYDIDENEPLHALSLAKELAKEVADALNIEYELDDSVANLYEDYDLANEAIELFEE